MTAKLTPQTRLLAVLGLVLVVAFAAMMVMRGGLLGSSSDEEVATLPVQAPTDPVTPVRPTPAKSPSVIKPAAVKILPGVPARLASALQRSKVVVAALDGGTTADRIRLVQARAGAKSVGAAFVTLDVRREAQAKAVASFLEDGSDATVLVVNRPGKVANSFSTYVDQAIVAQAAVNAGAVKPKAVAKSKATAKKAAAKKNGPAAKRAGK